MRILLIADVHANLAALRAVLAAAPAHDTIWNLGDTVGYGPDPAACLDLLADQAPSLTLAGNHDLAATGGLDLGDFNDEAAAAARWTMAQLPPAARAALSAFPSHRALAGISAAHGSPRDPVWEYVIDPAATRAALEAIATRWCLVGHSHWPLLGYQQAVGAPARLDFVAAGATQTLGAGRWLINPGSVGQPRDRDPRAAFAVLDLAAETVTWHRVAYDIGATQRAMRAAGLPAPLIARLARGE